MHSKIKGIILLVFSLFFILGLTSQGNEQLDVELLIKAFEETEANMDAYWLNIGIPYKKYENDQQLLLTGNHLSESLQLTEVKNLVNIGQQNIYVSKGTWGNGTEIELQIKKQNNQSKQLYLIFQLRGNQSLEDLKNNYNFLDKKLQENQINPKINSCIQGNINDKLSNVEQIVLIESILHNLGAKEVEKFDTQWVKSFSAYSSKIKYFIWTGSSKMNLQVATHINNLEQKTMLTMGTPIITIEY